MADKDRRVNFDELEDPGKRDYRKKSGGRTMTFAIIATIIFTAIVIIYYLLILQDSYYDNGVKYIREQNYDLALFELQQIPPSDSRYKDALSKINYIKGIRHFYDNQYNEAKIYLNLVEPNDEFYSDAKIILGRIETSEKDNQLLSQLESEQRMQEIEAEKESIEQLKNEESSQRFATNLIRFSDKFESELQLAKIENPVGMKSSLRTLSDLRQQMIDYEYAAAQRDPELISFKNLLNQWMSKRIQYLQKLITENALNEEDASESARKLKNEGDLLKEQVDDLVVKMKAKYNVVL
jgi:hypothetical protein